MQNLRFVFFPQTIEVLLLTYFYIYSIVKQSALLNLPRTFKLVFSETALLILSVYLTLKSNKDNSKCTSYKRVVCKYQNSVHWSEQKSVGSWSELAGGTGGMLPLQAGEP